MIKSKLWSLVVITSVILLSFSSARGQTTFGSIVGTVSDTSGAAIPDAPVKLTSISTTETRNANTDSSGNYQFVNLTPGPYRLDVEKTGFKHYTREPIVVETNLSARIDIGLELGQVTQTVEVTAQTPLLQSETSSLGQIIETRQVNELPLNGRNPMNLVALAPSVVPQGNSQGNPVGKNPFDYANYQIGGAITNQGAEYLDGIPLNNSYVNMLILIPTQDSLQEFKVQTNNLNAEWGRFAGGVINFTTKTGSNQFHGAAYEYMRNTVLNANDFFSNANGVKRSPFHQNQYGLNAGGPVYIPHLYDGHDKTFFFASFEGFRQRVGQTFLESVPTLLEKTGDFRNYVDSAGKMIPIYDPTTTTSSVVNGKTVFTRQQLSCNGQLNVICPGRINATSKVMLGEFADPTGPGQTNNFATSSSGGGNNDEWLARIDHNVSDKQHLSGRYTHWTNLNLPIDPFKTGVCQDRCTETFITHNAMIDDVYSFSPSTIMDVRVSYGRLAYDRTPSTAGLNLSKFGPGFAAIQNQVLQANLPIPCLNGGFDSYLGNVFCSQGAGSVIIARDDTARIAGSLTKIMGRHTLQAGGEFRRDVHNYVQTNTPVGMFGFNSDFTSSDPVNKNGGSALASFLLGYGTGSGQNTAAPVASQQLYPALYLQDQFKMTSRLTLNLGVRWEQNGPYSERFNRISVLQPNVATNLPQPGCSTLPAATAAAFGSAKICLPALKGEFGIVSSSNRPERYAIDKPWLQFAPRLGFAYQWSPKTVVRGGYGLFWISNAVEFDQAPNTDGLNSIGTPWLTSTDGGNSPCINAAPCNTGVVGPTYNLANPYPNGIIQPPGRNIDLYRSLQYGNWVWGLLPSNPYANYQQWNLDVQHELGDGTLVDLAYAAAKGTHLPDFAEQINPLPDKYLALGSHLTDQVPNPFQGLLGAANHTGMNTGSTIQLQQLLVPYPQYSGFSIGSSGWSNSIYHSLQAKLEKRMRGAGTVLVSYTLSKMITTGDVDSLTGWLEANGQGGIQNWNNKRGERSLSSYDVPQRLVVSYVVDLPVGKGRRFLPDASGVAGKLISGWGLEGVTTYQRGFPLNFDTTGGTNGQNLGQRPNKTGTGALSGRAESRLNKWFDTSVFSVPAPYTFGNESRVDPVLRQDGIRNYDFSLFKETRFGPEDRMGMQFRAEFFNLFNTPQFGAPNRTVGAGNFGQVSSQFNNPRLIQFALRFTF